MRFVLSFCLFVFSLMGKAEWGGNSVCWWFVCIFEFLVFTWGGLHKVLLLIGWYWVLYSSGFLCVSSHSFLLPRASSLVIWGLGVCTPTPKARGLISGQEWRLHKCFFFFLMALSEIKTNSQKWKNKDEPQRNDSYKIRQIIFKIMENIHPWAKSKQSNKNKVQ